ncbi:MAG TPA: ribbon-helix-helix domain-containing protein [Stellaceae bacterium]|jgi:predicted DNA-binding ribbon-helix-helix protein
MASEGEIFSERRGEAAPNASAAQAAAPPWEQRILQLDGKRYSLRLEHEFWTALETIASRRKLRLNRLVAAIDAQRAAESNLSSALRVYCLAEMERAAGSLVRDRRRPRRRAAQKSLA